MAKEGFILTITINIPELQLLAQATYIVIVITMKCTGVFF